MKPGINDPRQAAGRFYFSLFPRFYQREVVSSHWLNLMLFHFFQQVFSEIEDF